MITLKTDDPDSSGRVLLSKVPVGESFTGVIGHKGTLTTWKGTYIVSGGAVVDVEKPSSWFRHDSDSWVDNLKYVDLEITSKIRKGA